MVYQREGSNAQSSSLWADNIKYGKDSIFLLAAGYTEINPVGIKGPPSNQSGMCLSVFLFRKHFLS